MGNVVRLVNVEINNLKNVEHGVVEFNDRQKGNILGVYGQNGSGKTVLVDSILLLKDLMSGRKIPADFYHCIRFQSETAHMKYSFKITEGEKTFYTEYEIELLKNGEYSFCISREKLSVKELDAEKQTRLTSIFEYTKGGKKLFLPLKYYQYFEKNITQLVSLGVAQQLTENYNDEKQRPEVSSFLFSKRAQEVFSQAQDEPHKIYKFSYILQSYAIHDLAIVENSQYGLLALNLRALPVNIDWPLSVNSGFNGFMLNLMDVNVVDKELFPYIQATIDQINIVLKSLVPDIELEIYNHFDKLMDNGRDGVRFEVITIRNGARIPLLYESAGIKKIISICSSLVACFNRETYCLVVDELDAGIYEYLLGELLEAMQEKAKGQLVFTAHNLRPMEVLLNDSLVYTTINPKARYIRTSYIKNTQNKRLSYLRSIKLGGQKEKLYNDTNIYEIELAMRKAGKVKLND